MDPKFSSPCKVRLEKLNFRTPAKQQALSAELRKVINDRNILTGNSRKKMLHELDQLEVRKREEDKRNTLQEILTSELAYIKQIETIQEFFMMPIRNKNLLHDDGYNTLFGSINSIYKVNGALLEELKQDLMHLSSAFNKMAPFLKLYSEYAFNFMNAMGTLDELMQKKSAFSRFVQGQETRPEVQNKLSSLLIAPIQRIPRYCLLIKQVLDNTAHGEEDYAILKETYAKLNDVAKHIDSAVKDRENSEKLIALSAKVKDSKALIIQPGRRLIMESIIKVFQPKINEPADMYMILFSDIIMFCTIRKTKLDEVNSLKCMSIFPLRKCSVSQNVNMMIVIRCEGEKLVVYSEHGLTTEWYTTLKVTLRGYSENRSTLRKGSSSRRPAVRFNCDAYKDHGVSPGVGLRRKRRLVDEDDAEVGEGLQQNGVPEQKVKKPRLLQARKSIRSMIPSLVTKPKKIFGGKCSSDKANKKVSLSNGNDLVETDYHEHKRSTTKKDALFPLRAHFLQQRNGESPTTSTNSSTTLMSSYTPSLSSSSSNELVQYNPNVYVFGRQNTSKSFSFGGMISGISNSVKRAFGFR